MAQQAILVVHDEAPMREFIFHNLNSNGYKVLTAGDGSEALKLLLEHPLDLVLLDISLAGPDGLAVLEAVRRDMQLPVLMISGRAREADKVRAFELGADDYLVKPFGVGELLARVRALLRRTARGPSNTVAPYEYRGLVVNFSARRAHLNGLSVPLTRREFDVLAYLARNAGKVLLHRQLLQAVWGSQYGEETDYVWTFVQRIRRKIEPDRQQPRYILTQPGVGYVMPASEITSEAA